MTPEDFMFKWSVTVTFRSAQGCEVSAQVDTYSNDRQYWYILETLHFKDIPGLNEWTEIDYDIGVDWLEAKGGVGLTKPVTENGNLTVFFEESAFHFGGPIPKMHRFNWDEA